MKIFGWFYIVGLITAGVIRWKYSRYYRFGGKVEKNYSTLLDRLLLFVSISGFILPILYVFSPLFDPWDYHMPLWAQLIGIMLNAAAIRLLWHSHVDLGRFWSPFLEILHKHDMVVEGMYSQVRHPMYAAFLLWGIAQMLLITNWIAGVSLFVCLMIFYTYRVRKEEVMMLQYFGKPYRDYIAHTGRFIPPNPLIFLKKKKKVKKEEEKIPEASLSLLSFCFKHGLSLCILHPFGPETIILSGKKSFGLYLTCGLWIG